MSGQVDLFNKQVVFWLKISDMFTKQVGFESIHIAEYSWLDMTQNPTCKYELPPLSK